MIVTTILGIITIIFGIIAIIGMLTDDCEIAIGGIALMVIFMIAMLVANNLEESDIRTTCKTYCHEQGYSYDSVKTEGEEQYCICDKSLERHLIKQNTGVIIE